MILRGGWQIFDVWEIKAMLLAECIEQFIISVNIDFEINALIMIDRVWRIGKGVLPWWYNSMCKFLRNHLATMPLLQRTEQIAILQDRTVMNPDAVRPHQKT